MIHIIPNGISTSIDPATSISCGVVSVQKSTGIRSAPAKTIAPPAHINANWNENTTARNAIKSDATTATTGMANGAAHI